MSLNLDKHNPADQAPQLSDREYLNNQLSLELKLRQNCQDLQDLYKSSQNWSAVSQVTQSLVTNSVRIHSLEELLRKGLQSEVLSPFLSAIGERNSSDPLQTSEQTNAPQEDKHTLVKAQTTVKSKSDSGLLVKESGNGMYISVWGGENMHVGVGTCASLLAQLVYSGMSQ